MAITREDFEDYERVRRVEELIEELSGLDRGTIMEIMKTYRNSWNSIQMSENTKGGR